MSLELRQSLDAYAAEVLSPNPAAVQRMRAAVMAEARATLAAPLPAPPAAVLPPEPARPRRRFALQLPGWLRPFALRPGLSFAAAGLALLVLAGGALAGSAPGGPFYGARLWLEEASLPAGGQARIDQEERLLQARLNEAAAATAEGNGAAVQAALDAYRTRLADVIAAAGGDLTQDEHVAAMLGRHQAVLETLVTQFNGKPGNAAAAIEAAIDRTQAQIDRLNAESQGPGNGQGNGQTPNPTPKGSPAATDRPQHTPAANPTEKPQHTPPAHPTPPLHPTPPPAADAGRAPSNP